MSGSLGKIILWCHTEGQNATFSWQAAGKMSQWAGSKSNAFLVPHDDITQSSF